jgi:hypothetical protein
LVEDQRILRTSVAIVGVIDIQENIPPALFYQGIILLGLVEDLLEIFLFTGVGFLLAQHFAGALLFLGRGLW